jgi:hypothetical protein
LIRRGRIILPGCTGWIWYIFCFFSISYSDVLIHIYIKFAGKSFLLNTLIEQLHAENIATVVTATSGIAALTLYFGRTAHSTFGIPNHTLEELSTCTLSKQQKEARRLRDARVIIIDEFSMLDNYALHAIDRQLRVKAFILPQHFNYYLLFKL